MNVDEHADHPAEQPAPAPAPPPPEQPAPAEPPAPAAPPPEQPVAAEQAPQFGGTPPSEQVRAAVKSAADDPGFVVSMPLLTTGAWGHEVAVLAQLLDKAGHPNPVSAGIEPPMLTDEMMRTVRAFQESKGIDPTKPQAGLTDAPGADANGPMGPPLVRKDHEGIVDWRTWAALFEESGEGADVLAVAAIRYPAGSFA